MLCPTPQVSFFTPPGICLNTPFETNFRSFSPGRLSYGFEFAQEYPPGSKFLGLAQRLRYIGRYLTSVRSRRKGPGGAFTVFINRRKMYDDKNGCINCPGFLGCALCGFRAKSYRP